MQIQIRLPLRKHAYSNILKILPQKKPPKKPENFQIKKSDIFHISAQNTDCGYSLEPPKKNNVYPCKPQFYYIKAGLRGSKLYSFVFVMQYIVLNALMRRGVIIAPDQEDITKTRLFKYIENLTTNKRKFSDKKFRYFSYFCSKHRLWVLVRTASVRRF